MLGNAYCAKHFLILECYHRPIIRFDFKEGVILAVEL